MKNVVLEDQLPCLINQEYPKIEHPCRGITSAQGPNFLQFFCFLDLGHGEALYYASSDVCLCGSYLLQFCPKSIFARQGCSA